MIVQCLSGMEKKIQAESIGCRGDWTSNDGCCAICAVHRNDHWVGHDSDSCSECVVISSGTLRLEDLIPAFVDALTERMERASFEAGADAPFKVQRMSLTDDHLGQIERRMEDAGYYDSEQADWDLEWLFDNLDSYAAEGHHFGASEGDGACFGFWTSNDE